MKENSILDDCGPAGVDVEKKVSSFADDLSFSLLVSF